MRRQSLRIVGRLYGTFRELHALGCIQTMADEYTDPVEAETIAGVRFTGLMSLCNCNLCEGCPKAEAFNLRDKPTRVEQIQCKAFHKFHTMATNHQTSKAAELKKATSPPTFNCRYAGLTTKQIAEKLGISKNEVRRRKQAGTL